MLDDVLDRIDEAEAGLDKEPPMAGLRLRIVRDVGKEVARAALDLADATNAYERALLTRMGEIREPPGPPFQVRDRLVTIAQQAQWSKASELADLVCLLLEEAMGGGMQAADTAGPSLSNEERGRIEWLAREGWRVRRGSGRERSGPRSGRTRSVSFSR